MSNDTTKKTMTEAEALAATRRAILDKAARGDLSWTAKHSGAVNSEVREVAAYILGELDEAARLRAEVATLERQRDYVLAKLGIVGGALYGAGSAAEAELDALHDSAAAGRIRDLLSVEAAGRRLCTLLTRHLDDRALAPLVADPEWNALVAIIGGED